MIQDKQRWGVISLCYDIKKGVIPFVQDWFLNTRQDHINGERSSRANLLSYNREMNTLNSKCLYTHFQELKDFIPFTNPSYVNLVLPNLGQDMYSSPSIRQVLHDLLTEPQDLNTILYEESQSCLSTNQSAI